MTIKILLADDHGITREGMKALLDTQKDMTVVALAENGREAVRLSLDHKPDVIVMDINMPELNGIEATRRITAQLPQTKIIALSMFSEKRYVAGMLEAGVSAYLLKSSAFEELTLAIKAVMKNQGYLSQKITHLVMGEYAKKSEKNMSSPISKLTSREREVLQLIAEGFTSKKIADKLCVSVKTISGNRLKLQEKLQVTGVAALTQIAIKEGLVCL